MFHHDALTILKSKRVKGMHGTITVKQHALRCGVIGFSVLITVTLQLRFFFYKKKHKYI